jgi:hypothetical protein
MKGHGLKRDSSNHADRAAARTPGKAVFSGYLGRGGKANSGWRRGRETERRECSLERRERKAKVMMFM